MPWKSIMRKFRVEYDIEAESDIEALTIWLAEKTSIEYSRRYVNRIFDEIDALAYLAPILPKSNYEMPKLYHPDAKTYLIGSKKLTAIFHIDGEYVIVDKILPSALIKY